jgi:pimeloyl-ACP methyl ester carboxylesterase
MRSEHPSDPAPAAVRARNETVSVTDEGAGPVVVALHGYPGSLRDFRYLASVLSPSVRFVRVDMPGFGDAEGGGDTPSPAAHAALLLATLDALSLDRVVLLAHSMGGAVAVHAATEAPERIRGLVLLATPGLTPHQHLRRIPVRPLARALRPAWARRLTAPLLRRTTKLAGFPSSVPLDAIHRSIDFAAVYDPQDHARRCRAVTQPCLVAYAADDVLVEPAIGEALGGALPNGPRIAFPKGGHNIQKTQSVPLGEAVIAFVAQLP